MGRSLAVVGMVLAVSQPGPSRCAGGDPGKQCHAELSAQGPTVAKGVVSDWMRVHCDPAPATHAVDLRLEFRAASTGGEWTPIHVLPTNRTVPDAQGFRLTVRGNCTAGEYRARATITATKADGTTETASIESATRRFTLVECAGG